MTKPMDTFSLPDIFWELVEEEYLEQENKVGLNEDIWTTLDGRKIKVTDMNDSHLLNSINMLQENSNWRRILQMELDKRILPSVAKINIEKRR